jgi:hypothetical protein
MSDDAELVRQLKSAKSSLVKTVAEKAVAGEQIEDQIARLEG